MMPSSTDKSSRTRDSSSSDLQSIRKRFFRPLDQWSCRLPWKVSANSMNSAAACLSFESARYDRRKSKGVSPLIAFLVWPLVISSSKPHLETYFAALVPSSSLSPCSGLGAPKPAALQALAHEPYKRSSQTIICTRPTRPRSPPCLLYTSPSPRDRQ